jgi:hypothetical protein
MDNDMLTDGVRRAVIDHYQLGADSIRGEPVPKAGQVAAGATLRVHIAKSTGEKASAAGENEGTSGVLHEHRC